MADTTGCDFPVLIFKHARIDLTIHRPSIKIDRATEGVPIVDATSKEEQRLAVMNLILKKTQNVVLVKELPVYGTPRPHNEVYMVLGDVNVKAKESMETLINDWLAKNVKDISAPGVDNIDAFRARFSDYFECKMTPTGPIWHCTLVQLPADMRHDGSLGLVLQNPPQRAGGQAASATADQSAATTGMENLFDDQSSVLLYRRRSKKKLSSSHHDQERRGSGFLSYVRTSQGRHVILLGILLGIILALHFGLDLWLINKYYQRQQQKHDVDRSPSRDDLYASFSSNIGHYQSTLGSWDVATADQTVKNITRDMAVAKDSYRASMWTLGENLTTVVVAGGFEQAVQLVERMNTETVEVQGLVERYEAMLVKLAAHVRDVVLRQNGASQAMDIMDEERDDQEVYDLDEGMQKAMSAGDSLADDDSTSDRFAHHQLRDYL